MKDNIKENKFTIINDQGEELECEILFTVDSDETKKSYIIYTDNTKDESGNVKAYASVYDASGESLKLDPIETEKEWAIIENILSSAQEKVEEDYRDEN